MVVMLGAVGEVSGKRRYPLYRRLGGPQGRSGQVRKISPPPGLNPRTFQPVVTIPTELPGPVRLLQNCCNTKLRSQLHEKKHFIVSHAIISEYFTLPQDGFSKPKHVAVNTVLYKNIFVIVLISPLHDIFFVLS
jgi:hypothetical protein